MGEMPAFHLYRAQEVMKKIVERISEDCYHEADLAICPGLSPSRSVDV